MDARLITIKLLIFLGLSFVSGKSPGYFISAPNIFHLGLEETVSVTVSGVTRPVTVRLFLHDYPNRRTNFSHVEGIFRPDESGLLKIKVNPENLPDLNPDDKQYVYLVAVCSDPQLVFLKEAMVLISYRDKIVLVQTDKPIYTPSQTVKIRIIPLGFDLKPSKDMVNVIIKNPQGIRAQQWKGLSSSTGFITKALYLGEHTMIGNWTIITHYGHLNAKNTTVKFEVKEYVLPRFSVRIVGPNYVLPSATSIKIALVSKYTYGKPVQGGAVIRLTITGRGLAEVKFYATTAKLTDGKVTLDVDCGFIKKHASRPWFPDGRRLRIDADVIEEATGVRESAVDSSIYFVSTPYHVSYEGTAKYFKPALPFVVKVSVKYPTKRPAPKVPVRVSAVGKKTDGRRIDILTKIGGKLLKTLEEDTDGEGQAEFTLDIPRNTRSIKVQIKTDDGKLLSQENAVVDLTALAYDSPSGSYLHIRNIGGKVAIGDTSTWDVFQNRNITRLSVMVISRGRIRVHRSIVARSGVNLVSSLAFTVTIDMSPSARVVVYYVTKTNEIVADSAILDVAEQLPNKVRFQPSKPHPLPPHPGSNYDIRVTAAPGSLVGLLGVDESVYLLRNKNKLTPKKVFSDVKSLDLGCGVGPGKNTEDVFENAGLLVMRSNEVAMRGRQSYKCDDKSHSRKRRAVIDPGLVACCIRGRLPSRARCDVRARFMMGKVSVACRQAFLNCCREETGEKEIVVIRQRQFQQRNAWLGDESDNIQAEQIRKYFPETWIFEEHEAGPDGIVFLPSFTLPDTITTWVLQAVAISNTTGFGITEPFRIRTFKNFFVTLTLPYSVQRGEQISVMATIFNYAEQEVQFTVLLGGDPGYCSMSRPGQNTKPIKLNVKANDAKAVSFPIVPIRLGRIPIQVVATGQLIDIPGEVWQKDIVQRELLVVPEGMERRLVHSLVLDPQGVLRDSRSGDPNATTPTPALKGVNIVQNGQQMDSILLQVPKRAVPGSVTASIYLTGNLIGPVVTNLITGGLENILRMPMGCGEQNMIFLAPNVYVLQYLTNTRQVTADVEAKAYRFIQLGYQQELGFRRKDKSFSAFGENRPGSTWLTAFVIKVLCAAQKFDGVAIDDDLICESVTWLLQNQRQDGAFPEVHDVIHKSLIGGVHGDVAMTAFVLTALLECKCSVQQTDKAIRKAVHFLEREVDSLHKPHILALTTYTLALAKSARSNTANMKLVRMSTYDEDQNIRHWSTGGRALDVETAGYALLAQLLLGRLKYGGPVVTWLTQQRNAQGGFLSTQDTCVALQALAKYSEKTAGANLNLRVSVTSDVDANWRRIYHVTNRNALIQRKLDITHFLGSEMFIDSSGTGVGQMQIEIRHNIPSSRNETCMFDLDVQVREVFNKKRVNQHGIFIVGRSNGRGKRDLKSRRKKGRRCRGGRGKKNRCRKRKSKKNKKRNKGHKRKPGKRQKTQGRAPDSLDLKICTRYRRQGKSGMAILDIGVFTGFEPDKKSLIELQKNVRPTVDRFEFSERSVVLYISEVPSDKEFCAKFKVNRVFGVGTVQPVAVKIYDYYEPGDSCTRFYSPGLRSELLLGICEGDQCKCTQDGCMACGSTIQTVDEMLDVACKQHDFVIKGEVVLVDEEQNGKQSWLTYFVEVKIILKQGRKNLHKGNIMEYRKRAGCECPHLQQGSEYLFMGQEENAQFVLDAKTFIMPWKRQPGLGGDLVNVFRGRMKRGHRCI